MSICGKNAYSNSEGRDRGMKPIKLAIVAFTVITISLVGFIGCENGAPDPSDEDLEKLGSAMEIAIGDVDFDYPPAGVTISGDPYYDPNGGTITFTNYVNPNFPGITVNGSLFMKITAAGNTASVTVSGTITFSGTGAPAQSIGFDMTINLDFTDPYNPVITVSGTFSIDGNEFSAAGIGDLFWYYYYY
jgi:hypothetical protein